ncbi:MAG TPA: hypothetical protein VKA10_06500 [Prolixibacteraceae bacterium]|nr:hypothetical protein [Prolixibacteraceae bacterium]
MASVKGLKKDIDLVMSLVLNDCFYVLEYNEKVNRDAVMDLAGEVIKQHREFRVRANHPDGKNDPKKVKESYSKLMDEVMKTADEDLEKLSAEVKKTA